MILFGLRRGEVTTRDIVLDDICARFRSAEDQMRVRTNDAIDAAIVAGTLVERGGQLRTGDGGATWMLDVEIPFDDEPPVRVRRRY